MKKKEKPKVRMDFDLSKFRDLSDEEIRERFNKEVLPEIIKRLRQGGRDVDEECPVCKPWSYSFF